MAGGRRTEGVLAWIGAGAIAGALVLAALTLALHPVGRDEGVFAVAGWGWFWSCLIGAFVLMTGVRWSRPRPDKDPLPEDGWDYVVLVAAAAAVVSVIAAHGVFLGTDSSDPDTLTPSAFRAGVVVCAVALGLLFLLTSVRRPTADPRVRSLPALGAGALTVVLVGALTPVFVGPGDGSRPRHSVAEEPPDAGPVPDRVRETGWTWRPDHDAEIDRITAGVHGPLVVLGDGVVSLDGTDGAEVWSYRRPAGDAANEDISLWVGDRAYLTYTPVTGDDTEADPVTEAFDLVTGERKAEYAMPPEEGDAGRLLGWSDGVRVHQDWRARREADRAPGLSAWDAATGEEMWHRTLGSDGDQFCDGSRPRVRRDTVEYAVVCVNPDVVAERGLDVRDLVWHGDAPTEFHVVSVDLRTGEELWTHERADWQDVFVPSVSWTAWGTGDSGNAMVVETSVGARGLLLDTATGEVLLDFAHGAAGEDDTLSPERVVAADPEGVDVLVTRAEQGVEIQRVDTSGNRTVLVGAGGFLKDVFVEEHVALADQVLFTDGGQDTEGREPVSVLAVSPGERLGTGLDHRIVLSAPGEVRQLASSAGAVAALVSEYEGGTRVEGLVP
ncbi:PQQ-binding-like beta-propeller repeat protein [Nocardiopsis eucommiae]|uniref:outer membrane protein assembly factor BamB family protein n=1 Tax=Nocardiopsis eucommiae TaxID=2831970 RepID=UPI003D70713C